MIAIEPDTVGDWAQRRRLTYTTYRNLSEKPEVIELIGSVVDSVNERYASVEQIKTFRMIPKELDHEDGELTATQKVKRAAIAELFGDLVEDMYSGAERCAVTRFIQALVIGLGLASIYSLIALGFVIIYKSMRVVSFAQPGLMILGAYWVIYIGTVLDLSSGWPCRSRCCSPRSRV